MNTRYPRPADEETLWQARALPNDEVRRHAAVSVNNRHTCDQCFTCACAYVAAERRAGEKS